jgi:cystathionine beta-synthase
VAERLSLESPNGFLANQYHNPSNPRAHVNSTGPELWEQTDGEIDVFVSSMGTGGTITGTGRYLKQMKPEVKVVGVDPIGSIYYDYFKTGKMTEAHTYKVEGFGEDFLPSTMDFDVVDEVVRVSDRECFHYTRRLVREEGILTGGSSGGALCGAIKYAERMDRPMNMVVIMCDSFSRYMSKIFDDEWMRENGFLENETTTGTVSDMMVAVGASKRKVIAASLGQKVQDVIEMMKLHGISQLPVMDGERVVGVVAENDVLNHLLSRGHGNDPVDELAEANFALVEPHYSVNMVGQFFKQNKIVFVVDQGRMLAILTKIDFIDYVSRQMR